MPIMTRKTICLIQGPNYPITNQVISRMSKNFDIVLRVQWSDDFNEITSTSNNIFQVVVEKPSRNGKENRNLQRKSVISALRYETLRENDFIMKWRSDFLPLFNKERVKWLKQEVIKNKRIIIGRYRTIAVTPFYFSSLPDMYMFGSVSQMKRLWTDSNFDYDCDDNLSKIILSQQQIPQLETNPHNELFCLYYLNEATKETPLSFIKSKFLLVDDAIFKSIWLKNSQMIPTPIIKSKRLVFKDVEFTYSSFKSINWQTRINDYFIRIINTLRQCIWRILYIE